MDKLIKGRDGVIRAVRLRAGKSYLERPIQFLYPLELCREAEKPEKVLDPVAREFQPKRKAATDAARNIQHIYEHEEDVY